MRFQNAQIKQAMEILHQLITDAVEMILPLQVIRHTHGYVINRDPVRQTLVEKIATFNTCEKTILNEIRAHDADFTGLRIAAMLAKLKTYVGLARISEYPISKNQWTDWFTQEVWTNFNELKKLIRFAESV